MQALPRLCIIILLISLLLPVPAKNEVPLPIVIWYGHGNRWPVTLNLQSFRSSIEEALPGTHILTLPRRISAFSDEKDNGTVKTANQLVAEACTMIHEDEDLRNGYNAVGLSEGALFLRAVAQRCSSPSMYNLISLGGQHQGINGFMDCSTTDDRYCEFGRNMLLRSAYVDLVQEILVEAEYWHDSLNEELYRSKSIFLADINNENAKNQTYRENLKKLDNFVMVMFGADGMVVPKETEWFGFYEPGLQNETTMLRDSSLYREDWLGLREMDEGGKLAFLEVDGDHLEFNMHWFKENIINKYLK